MRKTPEMSIVIRRSPCDLIDPDLIKQAFRCLFGKTSFVRILQISCDRQRFHCQPIIVMI